MSLGESLCVSFCESLSTSLGTSLGEALGMSLSESLGMSLCESLGTSLSMSFGMSLGTPFFCCSFYDGKVVPINLDTFFISLSFSWGKSFHLTYLCQPLECSILCSPGHSIQYLHILQYINPFLEKTLTLIILLVEQRKL